MNWLQLFVAELRREFILVFRYPFELVSRLIWNLGFALMIFFAPRWYRLYRFRTHTFFWYRKKHPGLVSDAGTITCDRCSSKHLSVHALRRAPGTRAHFCKTCGKTLYFSAEGC